MKAAFDLGTSCGYARETGGPFIISGVLKLQQQRNESPGMRYIRFQNKLPEILQDVTFVAFEDVRFHGKHNSSSVAHVYGALKALLQMHCEKNKIPYTGFAPPEIKKFATGKGNANKDQMLVAAREKWPEHSISSHDQADALWILELARNRFPTDEVPDLF